MVQFAARARATRMSSCGVPKMNSSLNESILLEQIDPVEQRRPAVAGGGAAAADDLAIKEWLPPACACVDKRLKPTPGKVYGLRSKVSKAI